MKDLFGKSPELSLVHQIKELILKEIPDVSKLILPISLGYHTLTTAEFGRLETSQNGWIPSTTLSQDPQPHSRTFILEKNIGKESSINSPKVPSKPGRILSYVTVRPQHVLENMKSKPVFHFEIILQVVGEGCGGKVEILIFNSDA